MSFANDIVLGFESGEGKISKMKKGLRIELLWNLEDLVLPGRKRIYGM